MIPYTPFDDRPQLHEFICEENPQIFWEMFTGTFENIAQEEAMDKEPITLHFRFNREIKKQDI